MGFNVSWTMFNLSIFELEVGQDRTKGHVEIRNGCL